MTFGSVFGRTFSPTFQPHSISGGKWWLAGGINPANCIAAYQPKGAADYAASKVNLANPGTYDATNGAAYPTWDATNGWKFAHASSQYLNSNVVHANGWSVIVRFSNVPSTSYYRYLLGSGSTATTTLSLYSNWKDPPVGVIYGHGRYNNKIIAPGITSGVLAIANLKGYRDGTLDAELTSQWSGTNTSALYFGGSNANGTLDAPCTAYIQAAALYDTEITAIQVAALTTAMNAL